MTLNIEFTNSNKQYRIRRMDSRNIVFERRTEMGWALLGYHNAYSLRFAILDEISQDIIRGELLELFKRQNELLEDIGSQLTRLTHDACE